MTEERAAAVLRVLEAELPPSTVDIDRAVRAGRRRERTRRGLAAGALAGVTVFAGIGVATVTGDRAASPPATSAQPATSTSAPGTTCVATRLPGPDGATVGAISPNGRFVAGLGADGSTPLLWRDGVSVPVSVPAGVSATPHAVNNVQGQIAGLARRDGRTLPFLISGGAYRELPLPSGAREGIAHGVNASGDAAGEAMWPDGDSKAVRWPAGGGVTVLASTTTWATGRAIDDDGTVYGNLDDGGTPYVWGPDGTGRALPSLAGSSTGKAFGVAGDYAYGHAGVRETAGGGNDKQSRGGSAVPRWVRWQLSTGTVVEVTGLTAATGVDATGAVVGSAPGAARWRDGTVVALPGIGGNPATGGVVGTSRDGTTLVGDTAVGGTTVPTVWHC